MKNEIRLTTTGVLSFFEIIARSHPLIYLFFRSIIRFTNIFEKDFDGVKKINLQKKINIIDVGASDGIASKFFYNNLNTGTIVCVEPHPGYIKILKKINIKNIIIKPFAIGEKISTKTIFFPRYKLFNKNFDLITYTHYDKKLTKHFIKDFFFRKKILIAKEKLHIRKIGKINKKIHLIKIDTNGFEYSVLKGLMSTIKKDIPALLLEANQGEKKQIDRFLNKFSYVPYYYSINKKKFTCKKDYHALNIYYLQKKHLKN